MGLRIGTTHFKNTDFIFHGIMNGLVSTNGATYHHAHPPVLGKMLREGDLDIAPTSSIIYAENHKDLMILPDFSINALGRTMSILLFSETVDSLDGLEGKKVTVPGTSASSSALLRIILGMKGVDARFVYHEKPDLDSMLADSDAALLIGDQALLANFDKRPVIADLGQEWAELTGKKMVYALWVMTKDVAEREPERIREFYKSLIRSREIAYENMEFLSISLGKELGVSPGFMWRHLNTLDYNLGEMELTGLEEYYRMAYETGVIPEVPEIRAFEV